MNRCHFCGKILNEIPFECHRCGNIFCPEHRLPEYHQCSMLNIDPSFAYIPKPTKREKPPSAKWEKIKRKLTFTNFLNFSIAVFVIIFAVYGSVYIMTHPPSPPSQTIGIPHPTQSPKPSLNVTALELDIHNLINQKRISNGLSPLSFDPALADIARKHSLDMAQNGYFDHVNLQKLDPTDRANKAGYICRKNYGSYYTNGIAENIDRNNVFGSITYYGNDIVYNWNSHDEIVGSTVNGWMNSPGHRKNILTATYDREGIGVGIASQSPDFIYITEDFC